MIQDLEIDLTSCQVDISATRIAVGIIAEPALATLIDPLFENMFLASIGAGGIIALVIINLPHLTHGKQTPTYLGVEQTKFVARYGATPLYWSVSDSTAYLHVFSIGCPESRAPIDGLVGTGVFQNSPRIL